MWWSRDKAVVEGVEFVDIPLILVAYNGVSTKRCKSADCSIANNSNVPEKVNKARPGALVADAFRKSRTRNESPVRGSARVHFYDNALWIG
jgi:hypothetical protein